MIVEASVDTKKYNGPSDGYTRWLMDELRNQGIQFDGPFTISPSAEWLGQRRGICFVRQRL
jgi:hypothetical protein